MTPSLSTRNEVGPGGQAWTRWESGRFRRVIPQPPGPGTSRARRRARARLTTRPLDATQSRAAITMKLLEHFRVLPVLWRVFIVDALVLVVAAILLASG